MNDEWMDEWDSLKT